MVSHSFLTPKNVGWIVGTAILIACQLSIPARAQVLEPLPGRFVERFTDRVPTSGLLLAGMHWGKTASTFASEKLGLRTNPEQKARAVCVRVASQDGRYSGTAPYDVPAGSAEPKLKFPSRYLDVLQRMPAAEFAVRAIISEDCADTSSGIVVPATISPEVGSKVLVVLLNLGDTSTARAQVVASGGLADQRVLGRSARCGVTGSGARIAYSQSCEVTLSESDFRGPASLVIEIEALTGQITRRNYKIEITPQ